MGRSKKMCVRCGETPQLPRCHFGVCDTCHCLCTIHTSVARRAFRTRARATLVADTLKELAGEQRSDSVRIGPVAEQVQDWQHVSDPNHPNIDYGIEGVEIPQGELLEQMFDVPAAQLELDFGTRYANLVLAHDMLLTVFPGKLFCFPTPTPDMADVKFDSESAHVFSLDIPFQDGITKVVFCAACKSTRNLLLKEILSGETPSQTRSYRDSFDAVGDSECIHAQAFRTLAINLPPAPRGVASNTIDDIPPSVHFGVTIRHRFSTLYASVQSDTDPFDRVLLVLRGGNDWECFKCPRTATCQHKRAWLDHEELNPLGRVMDLEWMQDDTDEDVQLGAPRAWEAPTTIFPMDADTQKEIRNRRGFPTFCDFDPSKFTPTQLVRPQCQCGSAFAQSNFSVECVGKVYGMYRAEDIRVPVFHCLNMSCSNTLQFDGFHHGFLRTGFRTFVDLDLMNMVYLNLIVGATPLSATYRVVQRLNSYEGVLGYFESGRRRFAPIIIGDGCAKMACRREFATKRVEYPREAKKYNGIPLEDRLGIRDKRRTRATNQWIE
ncbi:Aste57867_10257 [Aphanomyces stellatus]|uniref:Aste57867_10257 protein n=1 Tax=Aphanomyces stellatus TaxID=120398 RepID=A0A485KPV5_9STRA|nr:hypothetical protein As57867_010218 [Aphanomyces stellatus]VFT87132.1 Aste57867_10257 [Aphanomyces stellatus]